MATDLSQELLKQVQRLSREEQLEFLAEVQKAVLQPSAPSQRASILQLRGLGKELWQSVEVDDYLRRERDSWDG